MKRNLLYAFAIAGTLMYSLSSCTEDNHLIGECSEQNAKTIPFSFNCELPEATELTRSATGNYNSNIFNPYNAEALHLSWVVYTPSGDIVAEGSKYVDTNSGKPNSTLSFTQNLLLNQQYKLLVFATKNMGGVEVYSLNKTDKFISFDCSDNYAESGNWALPRKESLIIDGKQIQGNLITNHKDSGKTTWSAWNTAFDKMSSFGDCFYYFADFNTNANAQKGVQIVLTRPLINVRVMSEDPVYDSSGPFSLSLNSGNGLEDAVDVRPNRYYFWEDRVSFQEIGKVGMVRAKYSDHVFADPAYKENSPSDNKTYHYMANFWMLAPKMEKSSNPSRAILWINREIDDSGAINIEIPRYSQRECFSVYCKSMTNNYYDITPGLN